jgi:hypothetical protein
MMLKNGKGELESFYQGVYKVKIWKISYSFSKKKNTFKGEKCQ